MILNINRGRILLGFDGKVVEILGEGHLPGHGSPGWVVYSNSIRSWLPPHHDQIISEVERQAILKALSTELQLMKMQFEID